MTAIHKAPVHHISGEKVKGELEWNHWVHKSFWGSAAQHMISFRLISLLRPSSRAKGQWVEAWIWGHLQTERFFTQKRGLYRQNVNNNQVGELLKPPQPTGCHNAATTEGCWFPVNVHTLPFTWLTTLCSHFSGLFRNNYNLYLHWISSVFEVKKKRSCCI